MLFSIFGITDKYYNLVIILNIETSELKKICQMLLDALSNCNNCQSSEIDLKKIFFSYDFYWTVPIGDRMDL